MIYKTQISAGLLMYRVQNKKLEIFLVHPGGPFWKNKDAGAWGIPAGLQENDEDLFETAKREFCEETGINFARPPLTNAKFTDLGFITYKSGKKVFAWAFEDGNFEPKNLISNTFKLEWPPKSGKIQEFPEIDKGDYFQIKEAEKIIFLTQILFLDRLSKHLEISG